MRQTIQLSTPTPDYPETIDGLDLPEHAFLLAVRCWVVARQKDADPQRRSRTILDIVGAADAASPLDQFMTIAARSTSRRVVTYCPCAPHVGEDEKHLLHAASLVQNGQRGLAVRVLWATMLTMDGTMLAIGPLEDVGARFGKSGLLFRLRETPPAKPAFPSTVEGWLSSLSSSTLH
ncbi:MAG TPA: hypothetical protein VHB27_23795 [Rhodopila sp.]|uniref:hypothetical protein n=1 Tax=Rhodopila sp. TaxID=2480087 RepID=UPI002B9973C9|nr:hypothetical protein [Rhodopila sp.]HVY18263.1 hypothetical protein [Rhodopila sp.]